MHDMKNRLFRRISSIALEFAKSASVFIKHVTRGAIGGVPNQKVFAIGFNKTGSSSIHDLFIGLGYHSYHGEKWRDTSRRMIFVQYDAFCDGIPDDLMKLDSINPGAKYILQVRELDSWISSRLEHISRRPVNRKTPVTKDWTMEDESVKTWVLKRNEYHMEVLEYFKDRTDDLLIVNFISDESSANKIAEYLNYKGKVDKPHANINSRKTSVLRHADMIARSLHAIGVDEREWKNDLLCPSLIPLEKRDLYPGTSSELMHGKYHFGL